MSSRRPDWLLLDRFLAGECSPTESDQVQRWLDDNPEAAAALGVFRTVIGRGITPEPAPLEWDMEEAWSRLDEVTRGNAGARHRLPPPLRRVDTAETANAETTASVPMRTPFDVGRGLRPAVSPWLRVAAVLVLLGSGTGIFLWRSASDASNHVAAAAPPRIITTQRSERADLRLADGTHVFLAPESRLTIPADFGRARRELTLVGEGYFEVVHDPMKPFLVRAAHGVVHDLGTRFSVRAYPGDSTVRVVVAEGQVVAGLTGSTLPLRGPILGRGDLARLDATGATILVRGVDVDRYQSWINGRLRFDATPLREVLPELARWYDVDAEVADSVVGDRRLTIVLRDEPLAQVLSTIAQITNARYEQTGRVVRFSALPATPLAPRKT